MMREGLQEVREQDMRLLGKYIPGRHHSKTEGHETEKKLVEEGSGEEMMGSVR